MKPRRLTVSMADGVLTSATLRHLSLKVGGSKAALRTAEYQGESCIVCPVIPMVGDSVIHPANAPTPELVPADVLQIATQSRNGRPVVMGHPYVDGEYVSAGSPSVMESYCFGWVFNAGYDSESGSVKAEMYLSPTMAANVGQSAVDIIDRINAGEVIEVSEGNYVIVEEESGVHNGKEYGAKWLIAIPDHLAVLPDGIKGACSVADHGCGANRASQSTPSSQSTPTSTPLSLRAAIMSQSRMPTYSGTETSAWANPSISDYVRYLFEGQSGPTSVSAMSSDLKSKIAAHTLLGDPAATNFSDLSFFPVVNPATGKLNENALRRVLRSKSNIDDKVLASAQDVARRLLNAEFGLSVNKSTDEEDNNMVVTKEAIEKQGLFSRLMAQIRSALFNSDLRSRLYSALDKVEAGVSYYIEDEDPDKKVVVYCTYTYSPSNAYVKHLWKRTYTVAEDGSITVGDDRVEVIRSQEYSELSEPQLQAASEILPETSCACHKGGEEIMTTAEKKILINRLVSAAKSPFTKDSLTALEAMDEGALQSLSDAYLDGGDSGSDNGKDSNTPSVPPVNPPATPPANTPVTTPITPPSNPDEVRISKAEYEVILAAANAHKAVEEKAKADLVASIRAAQSEFTEDDLKSKDISELQKLDNLLKTAVASASADYSASRVVSGGGGRKLRDMPDTYGAIRAAKNRSTADDEATN